MSSANLKEAIELIERYSMLTIPIIQVQTRTAETDTTLIFHIQSNSETTRRLIFDILVVFLKLAANKARGIDIPFKLVSMSYKNYF